VFCIWSLETHGASSEPTAYQMKISKGRAMRYSIQAGWQQATQTVIKNAIFAVIIATLSLAGTLSAVAPQFVAASSVAYNGAVTGSVEVDGSLAVSGNTVDSYETTISGDVTDITLGQSAEFEGTISGDIEGTIVGGVNYNGFDTLSAEITGSGADGYVYLIGYFTGPAGEFNADFITVSDEIDFSEEITISGESSVEVGETIQFTATTDGANQDVAWTVYLGDGSGSSYGDAAINQDTGLLTANAEGKVIVIASALDGSLITKNYEVTITPAPEPVGSVHNTTQDNFYETIQEAIDEANDGDTIEIGDDTYNEDLQVNKADLTLTNGSSPVVNGQINVTASGVTISGLTITNPTGGYGVVVNGATDVVIDNNVFTDIGSSLAEGSAQAVYLNGSEAEITNNEIANIGNTSLVRSGGSSSKGVYVGDTAGSGTLSGILIENNNLTNIAASTDEWNGGNGGRGAYGILINYGGNTDGARIARNTISNLEGLWVHAIGLEGNTPNAEVVENDISNITEYKAGYENNLDGSGVFFQDNASMSSVTINRNNFFSDGSWYGVAMHSSMTGSDTSDAEKNYWGTVVESEVDLRTSTSDSIVIDYNPWLCQPFQDGNTVSVNSSCDFSGPEVSGITMYVNGIESTYMRPGDNVTVQAEITDDDSGLGQVRLLARSVEPSSNGGGYIDSGYFVNKVADIYERTFTFPADNQYIDTHQTITETIEGLSFYIKVFDTAGNYTNSDSTRFTNDRTAPSMANIKMYVYDGTSYVEKDVVKPGDQVRVEVEVEDAASGVEDVEFRIQNKDGQYVAPRTYETLPIGGDTYRFEFQIPSDGKYINTHNQMTEVLDDHTFWARATDDVGNYNHGISSDFTYDQTAPVATLVSPSNGTVLNGASVTQEWESGDEDVAYYIYESYDDAGANNLRWNEQFTTTSKTANNVSETTYWWRVKAVDHAGNQGEWSNLWKITVDNTAPPAPILSAEVDGESFTSGESTNVGGVTAIWDKPSSDTVRYEYSYWNDITDSPWTESNPWSTSVYSETRYGAFTEGEGTHYIRVRAIDLAGNVSDWSNEFVITYDNTAPIFDIDPASSDNTTGDEVILTATSDELGNYTYIWIVETGATINGENDEEEVTVTSATEGTYEVTLTVTDEAGNQANETATVTFAEPDEDEDEDEDSNTVNLPNNQGTQQAAAAGAQGVPFVAFAADNAGGAGDTEDNEPDNGEESEGDAQTLGASDDAEQNGKVQGAVDEATDESSSGMTLAWILISLAALSAFYLLFFRRKAEQE